MTSFRILTFLFLFTIVNCIESDDFNIIFGTPVENINRYPYIVAIYVSWFKPPDFRRQYHTWIGCSGSIVDKGRSVLTAAHCLDRKWLRNARPHQFSVTVNSLRRDGSGSMLRVKSILIHPNYKCPKKFSNDLAILRLDLEHSTVKSLLPELSRNSLVVNDRRKDPDPGLYCVAAGWGRTNATVKLNVDADVYAEYLREVTIPIVSYSECIKLQVLGQGIDDTMLCAGEPNKGVCTGDSGTPLICDYQGRTILAGVVSSGRTDKCAQQNSPAIFASTGYNEWLKQSIVQDGGVRIAGNHSSGTAFRSGVLEIAVDDKWVTPCVLNGTFTVLDASVACFSMRYKRTGFSFRMMPSSGLTPQKWEFGCEGDEDSLHDCGRSGEVISPIGVECVVVNLTCQFNWIPSDQKSCVMESEDS